MTRFTANTRLLLLCTVAATSTGIAHAQSAPADNADIVVTATPSRISVDLAATPGSVTVVSAEELATQSRFGNDLGEILQRTVPGFGLSSSGSYSNFSQTLRGRKPAVFIDGVPTTTPLRDGGRDLRLISPSAIGQIEVIRGATALYGLGGAGGLINYATREPGKDGFRGQTDLAVGMSFTNPSDSLNFSVDQLFEGGNDRIGFLLSGYYEEYNSLFDAKGNRIPPNPQGQGGIADTRAYNIYGKVVFNLTDTQSLAFSGNYYDIKQDSEYSNQPGVGVFGSVPTPAQRVPALGRPEITRNWLLTGRYMNTDVLGGKFTVQGYYGEYDARFGFAPPPTFPPNGGQSQISAERYGIRADMATPVNFFGNGGDILWGVDYARDDTSQPVEYIGVGTALLVPLLQQESIAPFLQFNLPVNDLLTLRGGLRWENATLKVDTFTTQPLFGDLLPGGVTVQGGSLDYEKLLFNIGAVVSPFRSGALTGVSFYAGFSQGFSVGDFGRAIRATTAESVEEFGFKAQIIDSYEIGIRADYDKFKASLAGYVSTSQLGSTFNAVTLELARAPEKVWGFEAVVDVYPTEGWNLGSSVSWVDGELEDVTTGAKSPLDTSRIAPLKATFHVQYAPSDDFSVRVQYTYSGRQQRFAGNPTIFGRADVEAFSLVDLAVSGRVGPGRLTFAVNNLFNAYYFTPDSFRFADPNTFTTGMGTTGRLSYSINY